MTPADRPIETPRAQRIEEFKQRKLPVLVWSAAVLACIWMLAIRVQRFEHVGLARAAQYEISTAMTARVDGVLVEAYDHVEAGQIVATLDDSELAARIERSKATVRQLDAELAALKNEFLAGSTQDRAGWVSDLRRFEMDEQDRRLAGMELRVTIEGDEIELERHNLQVARAEDLLRNGLTSQLEYDELRLLRDGVAKRLEENRNLLSQTEAEFDTASARRKQFENGLREMPDVDPVMAPLREAIAAESYRMREIEARQDVTVLRSPVAGQVTQILCQRGQTVVPGETIMLISESSVAEIVAYLDEPDGRRVRAASQVRVSSIVRPGSSVESYVVRVGPGVEELPPRLWRNPAIPDYGRAVIIAALPGMDFAPGELLSVRLESH